MRHGLPQEDGKILVASPGDAARMAELAEPELAERIYTLPGLPAGTAYVIDLDWVAGELVYRGLEPGG